MGPQFEPAIAAGFQIKVDLEFGTGFEVVVGLTLDWGYWILC